MPYPNEHACRLVDPSEFEPGSFRRLHMGSGADGIVGRLKGQSTTTLQTIRYPTASFSAAEARAHCARHKGSFEAATGGE